MIEDLTGVLHEFQKGTGEYAICQDFLDYLHDTATMHIYANGINDQFQVLDSFDLGYPHRWSESYIKGRFAKMYVLDDWVKAHPGIPMTFLTLTVRQDKDEFGEVISSVDSIKSNFDRLVLGWKRLRTAFQNIGIKHMDYVGTCEPHQTGNPHYHIVIFHKFNEAEIDKLKALWVKWDMGSYEHGLDFDFRDKSDINSIRNYLLSYMLKSLPGYKSKFKETIVWTAEELLFNAVAWHFHYRTWFASFGLSRVMKYQKQYNDEITWISTELSGANMETVELWRDDKREILLHIKKIKAFRGLIYLGSDKLVMTDEEIDRNIKHFEDMLFDYEDIKDEYEGDYSVYERPKKLKRDYNTDYQRRL